MPTQKEIEALTVVAAAENKKLIGEMNKIIGAADVALGIKEKTAIEWLDEDDRPPDGLGDL